MTSRAIQIVRASDGNLVEAKLYENLHPIDLTIIERQWAPWRQKVIRDLLDSSIDRAAWPESLHWDWSLKADQLKLLAFQCNAIDCENEWQGAMVIDSAFHRCRADAQRGKPLIYVEYIEAAPWNWRIPEIGQQRRFRGIGELLLTSAVECSFDLGFKGRLGLHALPQAEGFYEIRLGMTPLGEDVAYHGLKYFELTEAQALQFLGGGQ